MALKPIGEAMQDWLKHKEEMAKKCFIDKEHFVLAPFKNFEYDIAFSRIDSKEKLLSWLAHLSEKNWFDMELCRCFMHTVANQFGWDLYKY